MGGWSAQARHRRPYPRNRGPGISRSYSGLSAPETGAIWMDESSDKKEKKRAELFGCPSAADASRAGSAGPSNWHQTRDERPKGVLRWPRVGRDEMRRGEAMRRPVMICFPVSLSLSLYPAFWPLLFLHEATETAGNSSVGRWSFGLRAG